MCERNGPKAEKGKAGFVCSRMDVSGETKPVSTWTPRIRMVGRKGTRRPKKKNDGRAVRVERSLEKYGDGLGR